MSAGKGIFQGWLRRTALTLATFAVGVLCARVLVTRAADDGGVPATAAPAAVPTAPVTSAAPAAPAPVPATRPAQPPPAWGPDVVVLRTLSDAEGLFEPVPFDHKGHASMADMIGGCTTCHHHTPEVDKDHVARGAEASGKAQADSARHPKCETCHEVRRADLRQPGLKGAYHRQCLSCHKEWTGTNQCSSCHRPKEGEPPRKEPSVADVMGRMHPPTTPPDVKAFVAGFAPADGKNVLFRHKEHVEKFGLRCIACHSQENSCGRCHDADAQKREAEARAGRRRVLLDRTWDEAHAQCRTCHRREENRCSHCHYKDGQDPPKAFEHAFTGQVLDANHAALACAECHGDRAERAVRSNKPVKAPPTCGTARCHPNDPKIAFPAQRPGPISEARTIGITPADTSKPPGPTAPPVVKPPGAGGGAGGGGGP